MQHSMQHSMQHLKYKEKILIGKIKIQNKIIYSTTNRCNKLKKNILCYPINYKYPKCLISLSSKTFDTLKFSYYYVQFQYISNENCSKNCSIYPKGKIISFIGETSNELIEYKKIILNSNLKINEFFFHLRNPEILSELSLNTNAKLFEIINLKNLQDDFGYIYENDNNIISIDPITCKDIDDALSYNKIIVKESNKEIHKVTIFISDISFWIKYLELNKYLQNQKFTIYSNKKNYNIFPTILSEYWFSLKKNLNRLTISLHLEFEYLTKTNTYKLTHYFFQKSIINVFKNLNYNKANKILKQKHSWTKQNKKLKFILNNLKLIAHSASINHDIPKNENKYDAHEIIEIYMILYNKLVAEKLITKNQKCILRSHNINFEEKQFFQNMSTQTKNNFENIKCTNIQNILKNYEIQKPAKYIIFTTKQDENNHQYNYHHSDLKLNYYCHCTSPIRRIVDIYNQFSISCVIYLNFEESQINKQIRNYVFKDVVFLCKLNNNYIENLNYEFYKTQKIHREINAVSHIYHSITYNIKNYECYLIDFTKEYLYFYVAKFNFFFKKQIIHYQLQSILQIIVFKNQKINLYNIIKKTDLTLYKYQKLYCKFIKKNNGDLFLRIDSNFFDFEFMKTEK